METTTLKILGEAKGGNLLISYLSPTILLAAISLLQYFSMLEVSGVLKKLVIYLSPVAFSVYLIHTAPLVWEHVLAGVFSGYARLNPFILVIVVLVTAISIFILCTMVDIIRIKLFNVLNIRKICEELGYSIGCIIKKVIKED